MMADFMQAVKWMKEGKKVRRQNWCVGNYIYLGKNSHYLYYDGKVFVTTYMDTEATDWEIYEEEVKESTKGLPLSQLRVQLKHGGEWGFQESVIKEFIQKVKETKVPEEIEYPSGKHDFDSFKEGAAWGIELVFKEIDKRAGDL